MSKNQDQTATQENIREFKLRPYRGLDLGLGIADPMAEVCATLERKYPGHLVLVQSGKFLHGYNRGAYVLHMLKKYKLTLAGTSDKPHLRCGFPAANYKQKLWPIMQGFQIPYVVYLGNRKDGYTAYVCSSAGTDKSVMQSVPDNIVSQLIADLLTRGQVNQAATKELLSNPDNVGFKMKTQAQDLDNHLTQALITMSRDYRAIFGENARECMARIMRCVYEFGITTDKAHVLAVISANLDLLKHYFTQSQLLSGLKKFAVEHLARLAVELGRLVGGLIKKNATVPA